MHFSQILYNFNVNTYVQSFCVSKHWTNAHDYHLFLNTYLREEVIMLQMVMVHLKY